MALFSFSHASPDMHVPGKSFASNGIDSDYELKILLIGDSGVLFLRIGVGKSCITNRFINDSYTGTYTATSCATSSKRMMIVDGKTINFEIFDTSGLEQIKTVTRSYIQGGLENGIMLVYDVTNLLSIKSVGLWSSIIGGSGARMLIGNKCDDLYGRVDCFNIRLFQLIEAGPLPMTMAINSLKQARGTKPQSKKHLLKWPG